MNNPSYIPWRKNGFASESKDITHLLNAVRRPDVDAQAELSNAVYDQLHAIAQKKMASEAVDHTLQPTALVHEADLRLLKPDGSQPKWNSRGHFFVAVAESMRRILIESVRRKQSLNRGGDLVRTEWDEAEYQTEVPADDILAVHEALGRLEGVRPDLAKLVLLRYFAGMSIEETASALDVSPSSIDRQWRAARAWLQREISESLSDTPTKP